MACWGVGNQLTTSGNHLHSLASAENPIHTLVGLLQGKANTAGPRDPGDSCQTFSAQTFWFFLHILSIFFSPALGGGKEGMGKRERGSGPGSDPQPATDTLDRLDPDSRQLTQPPEACSFCSVAVGHSVYFTGLWKHDSTLQTSLKSHR